MAKIYRKTGSCYAHQSTGLPNIGLDGRKKINLPI